MGKFFRRFQKVPVLDLSTLQPGTLAFIDNGEPYILMTITRRFDNSSIVLELLSEEEVTSRYWMLPVTYP